MGWAANRRYGIALLAVMAGFGVALALAGTRAGAASPIPAGITGGQTLTDGSTLQSPDGHYQAVLSSGLLSVRIAGGRTLTQIGTSTPGAYAVLQPNGMFVTFAPNGQVLWASGESGSSSGCPVLELQPDGNLVDYDPAAIWSAHSETHGLSGGDELTTGWSIYSSGYVYLLEMQSDGNLVLYNDSHKAIWQTGTSGNPGALADMQTDGNLVVYSAAGKALFGTKTSGNPGAKLDVQSDGNLVIYSTAGKALWESKSTGKAGTGSAFGAQETGASATPCPATVTAPTTTLTQTQTQTATVTSTQTVVVPTTTVLTVAAPAPTRLRHFDVRVTTDWYYQGQRTFLHQMSVGRLPRGVELTATYNPHLRHHRVTVRHARRGASLVKLIRQLRAVTYRPGQTLNLNLTRPGYQHEWATFTFRPGKLPLIRPLPRKHR